MVKQKSKHHKLPQLFFNLGFFAAADSAFDDNVDSNGDFDVVISSVTSATVPEPGFALGSLVFGTYSIGWRFLRKRQKSRSI